MPPVRRDVSSNQGPEEVYYSYVIVAVEMAGPEVPKILAVHKLRLGASDRSLPIWNARLRGGDCLSDPESALLAHVGEPVATPLGSNKAVS